MRKYCADKMGALRNDEKRGEKKERKKQSKIKTNESIDTSDTFVNVKITQPDEDDKRDELFFTLIKSYGKDMDLAES